MNVLRVFLVSLFTPYFCVSSAQLVSVMLTEKTDARVATNIIFRELAEQHRKLVLIIDKLWGKRPAENHVGGIVSVCQLWLGNMSRNSLCNLGIERRIVFNLQSAFSKIQFFLDAHEGEAQLHCCNYTLIFSLLMMGGGVELVSTLH